MHPSADSGLPSGNAAGCSWDHGKLQAHWWTCIGGGRSCDTSLGLRVCVLAWRGCSQEGVGGTFPAVAGSIHQAFVQPSSAFRPFHLSLLPSIKRVPSHLHQSPRQRFTFHSPSMSGCWPGGQRARGCACGRHKQGSEGSRHTGIVTCCGEQQHGSSWLIFTDYS